MRETRKEIPPQWRQLSAAQQDAVSGWLAKTAAQYGYDDGTTPSSFDPSNPDSYDGLCRVMLEMQDVQVGDTIQYDGDSDEIPEAGQGHMTGKVTCIHYMDGDRSWVTGFSLDRPLIGCDGADRYVDFREFAGVKTEMMYFYSPVKVVYFTNDDTPDPYRTGSGRYRDVVNEAINAFPGELYPTNDLMHYLSLDDKALEAAIRAKIPKAVPSVIDMHGELYGLLEAEVIRPLSGEELEVFREYIKLQYRDGWGDEIPSMDIPLDNGDYLCVRFCPDYNGIYLDTESEFSERIGEPPPRHQGSSGPPPFRGKAQTGIDEKATREIGRLCGIYTKHSEAAKKAHDELSGYVNAYMSEHGMYGNKEAVLDMIRLLPQCYLRFNLYETYYALDDEQPREASDGPQMSGSL